MTIRIAARSVLMILVITTLFLISGCKKDSTSSGQQGSVRLRSIYTWFNYQPARIVDSIIYEGNRVSRIVTYEKHGTMTTDPTSEVRYTYNGNVIVEQFSWLYSDTVTPDEKYIFTINNNLLTSMVYAPSGSEGPQKEMYDYDQGLLTRIYHYDSISGLPLEVENKSELYYMDATTDSIVDFVPSGPGIWGRTGKLVFEYYTGIITSLILYTWSPADGMYHKDNTTSYSYTGRDISSIGSGNAARTYKYNPDGSLIQTYDGSNPNFSTITYQYEAGSGNYQFLHNLMDPLAKLEQNPTSCHIP